MRTAADAVTARALRHALEAGRDVGSAARDLAALARGNHWLLELARRRIERGVAERPSGVGLRARAMLREALELVAADGVRITLADTGADRQREIA